MSQPPPEADATPSDCERIIIVGAGGFGREVLQWARHAWPEHVHKFAGFVSADPTKLDGHAPSLPILATPDDFELEPTDGFILGIGIPRIRRVKAEQLEARGARFLTLIHPTAIVAPSAVVGKGSILCPFSIVSCNAVVGPFSLLNYHSSIGHDASVGAFAVLSPYATLGGNARVCDDVFLGLQAAVGPGVTLGPRSQMSAGAVALHDAEADSLVYGVPGRSSPYLVVTS